MNAAQLNAANPNFTPTGNSLIMVNDEAGAPFAITLDKLLDLLSGHTIAESVIESAEYAHMITHDDSTNKPLFIGAMSWWIVKADTSLFFSHGGPTKFSIPNGVTKVEITAQLVKAAEDNGTPINLSIIKNGVLAEPITYTELVTGANLYTGILDVVENDYFEVHSDGNLLYNPMSTWFKIKVIERVA